MYKNPKKKERGISLTRFSDSLFRFSLVCERVKPIVVSDHGGSLMQPKVSSSRQAEEPGKESKERAT